jgi:TGF-beta propeptide
VKLVLALISLIALLSAPTARADILRTQAVADVSFPFWCDWGYDWNERCWWDDSTRLAVGGDVDKVWRAGVRFALSDLPPGSGVLSATLRLYFDGTCVAPRGGTRLCDGRSFDLDVHQIFTRRWFGEREVEIGQALDETWLGTGAGRRWVSWNVSEAVAGWVTGDENAGLLVKLADGQEDYGVSGPKFASMSYADRAVRPMLEISYVPPQA